MVKNKIWAFTSTYLFFAKIAVETEVIKYSGLEAARAKQNELFKELRLLGNVKRKDLFDTLHKADDSCECEEICLVIARFKKEEINNTNVVAVFDYDGSYVNWAKNIQKYAGMVAGTNQGHFDIAQVHALALQAELRTMATSTAVCTITNDDAKKEAEDMLRKFAALRASVYVQTYPMIDKLYDGEAGISRRRNRTRNTGIVFLRRLWRRVWVQQIPMASIPTSG